MDQTFPRSRRLSSANDFQAVWKKAKKLSGGQISLVNCPNGLGHPRLGASISKKNVRRAVDRNRLKRVARETFRLNQAKLDGLDIIVVGYKGAGSLNSAELQQLFMNLWNRLAIRCKKPS